MIMCTGRCDLACDYCAVEQNNTIMPEKTLQAGIDLLLTTKSKECQLRFWGGEPLLAWDLVQKGILYAEEAARTRKKKIRFMVTTNGLSLDAPKLEFLKGHSAEVMFSLDGAQETNRRHRFSRSGKDTTGRMLTRLRSLIRSGVPYFVNMVVSPDTTGHLLENLRFFHRMGVERVQLCYRCGVPWPDAKISELLTGLERFIAGPRDPRPFARDQRPPEFLMNLVNECEPTMLSQELILDVDGHIYYDAALFLEKIFPRLRRAYHAGRVDRLQNIDMLYRSKGELFGMFRDSCGPAEREILFNNIRIGLKLDDLFKRASRDSLLSNEHPALIPIVRGNFREQRRVLKKFGIDSLFLYLDGPCLNDCLFCKQKNDPPAEMFRIEPLIADAQRVAPSRLCLIGNDPLLHPRIATILAMLKKSGFRSLEIMTSGEKLSDKDFCKRLIASGGSVFSLPIFGTERKLHDAIVGKKGSFSRLMKAIDNILSCGGRAFIHTNLIRHNLVNILELEHFVTRRLQLPFVVLPIRPKSSNRPFGELMPSYGEVIKKTRGVSSLMGFPLCVVKKVQKELLLPAGRISDSLKFYLLDQRFVKTTICRPCRYITQCAGLFGEYIHLYGMGDIAPIR